MDKNAGKRLLASIGTILVLLSTSGCKSKSIDVSQFFSDEVVEEYNKEQEDLLSANSVYKDIFFKELPVLSSDYNKEYLQELFKGYYLDMDFEGAYIFLNEFINSLTISNQTPIDNNVIAQHLNFDCREYGYNFDFTFVKDDKMYFMDFHNSDHILEHYDNVYQKVTSPNLSYSKHYSYKFNQLPGDKNAKKDKAYWDIYYTLDYEDAHVMLTRNSTINKKDDSINTLDTFCKISIYQRGEEVYSKKISESLFNDYATELYYIYLQDLSIDELFERDFAITKHLVKEELVLSLK